MKEIYKRIRRARAALVIIFGILSIVIGAGLLLLREVNFELIDYFTAKEDVFDTAANRLATEYFYRCENNLLLDYYASDDEGYYFITPHTCSDGTNTYIGFYVYERDADTAFAIVDETWSYVETNELPETYLSGCGYVYNMGSTEKEYFQDWFIEAGADEETINNLVYKTYVLTPVNKILTAQVGCWIFFGLVFLLGGLWLLLSFIFGSYKRGFRKTMQKAGVREEELVYDMQYATHLKQADLGRRYAVLYGVTTRLIVYDKVVWAYLSILRTRHMLYGVIPTGTTKSSSIRFVTRDHGNIKHGVRSEKRGQEILQHLSKAAPHILVGYDEKLRALETDNFAQLVQYSDERRNGEPQINPTD